MSRYSQLLRLPARLLLLVALCLTCLPAHAQTRQPAAGPSAATLTAVRTVLARELGVESAALTDTTDLIKDLKLDQAVVYYALLALYQELRAAPPPAEKTVVREIAAHIDQGTAGPARRSVGAARSTSDGEAYVQTVYYLTNRKGTGNPNPAQAFGGERSEAQQVSFGSAEVSIPRSHKSGQLESVSWLMRQVPDPKLHIFVMKLNALGEAEFYSRLAGNTFPSNEVLVYIHGYNTSFDDALRRAGQISFDFGFKGAPVAFSWPSRASVGSYSADSESVLWSAAYIERFLSTISEKLPGRKIHVVAHSMGTKGLLYAMRLLAYRNPKNLRLESVILCAPDFDARLFVEQFAPLVQPLAQQWAIYSSRKDVALLTSSTINAAPRLGMPVWPVAGYDIINASEIEVTPWSLPDTHSYYASKQPLIDDMVAMILGRKPTQRGLKENKSQAGLFWTLAGARP